jgi:hypothetical protein
MSARLMRRIEKLEEEAARERASNVRWSVTWIDAVSEERTVDGGVSQGSCYGDHTVADGRGSAG